MSIEPDHPRCPECRRRDCVVYLSETECKCTKCGRVFLVTYADKPK